MENGFIEWPNKALYRISDLRQKVENEKWKWVCRPNMALHLQGI